MKQNITLSIEKELIKKGKIIAARKDTSVSKMLSDLIKEVVDDDDRFEAAKRNTLNILKKGFHFGGELPGSARIYTSAKTFVDTNILICAHDLDAGKKHEIAKSYVTKLWGSKSGVIGTQVLQELYVTLTRKIPSPPAECAGSKNTQQLSDLGHRRK